jgi:hypothetical protein
MRSRSAAWGLTVLTVIMVCVIIWRVTKGWPAGPKTNMFIAATVIVLVATIFAWRKAPASGGAAPPTP